MPNVPELDKFKRDSTAMPDYYKAWDKFGKALDELDEDEVEEAKNPTAVSAPQPQSAAEMMARTSGAAPNTSIVIKGGLRKPVSVAEEFKQQGNSYFVSLEYSKAIDCYNKCLRAIDDYGGDLEIKKLVLSNRAQAYIKLKVYNKAYEDAQDALSIDH
jgi:tetratricopeptide (TPR) repeat protein